MAYLHTMEYYSATKKEWNFDICNNMDGPRGYYAKWSQSDKKRQIPYDLIYMWNKKTKQNSVIQNRMGIAKIHSWIIKMKILSLWEEL